MISTIINQLTNTPSRNSKIDILTQHSNNNELQQFFRLALDPLISFGIFSIPTYTPAQHPTSTIVEAFEKLQALEQRKYTGHAGIKWLTDILESLSVDDAALIEMIIEKAPRCGVQIALCNTVWGDEFILDFPVMKASAMTDKTMAKIVYPAISQLKVDGARCQIVASMNSVTVYSSNGHVMELFGVFDWLKMSNTKEITSWVYDGELVVKDENGNILPRKQGNGIVNKAIKGTVSETEAKMLHFVMFDIIPFEHWKKQRWDKPYVERLKYMYTNVSEYLQQNASIDDTEEVYSETEAVAHFKRLYERGLEGTILKNKHGIWENKRSADQVKMKGILSCDLQVVGFEPGTGKHKGKIGALICESSDKQLRVNVGSGLTDQHRATPIDQFLNKVAEITYNEKILSKVEGSVYSLFSPRFAGIRYDKDVADTIDNIT